MRRSATAAVLALVALVARPGVAMAVPVDVSGAFGGFRASAMWWFPPESEGGAQTFAFAEIYQAVTTLDGGGIAVIGIGACVLSNADDSSSRVCRGAGFAHELVAGEFELSPTLDSARVDYFERDEGYHVTWKATDAAPTVAPSHGFGDSAVAAGGKVFRHAVADGTIRGMALDQAVSQTADLSRGGGFGATLQPGDRREMTFRLPARG